MSNIDIIGLLGPLVPILFACTFFVFWLGQRNAPHILQVSIAFALLGASNFFVQYVASGMSYWTLTISGFMFCSAIILVFRSLAVRGKFESPTKSLFTISYVGLFLVCILSFVFNDIGPAIIAMNATYGVLFMIGALHGYFYGPKEKIDMILAGVLGFVGFACFTVPFAIWTIEGVVLASEYSTSTYWAVLNFSLVFFGIILSLTLITLFAGDLVAQIRLLSEVDSLTGVRTRRAFDNDVAAIFAQRNRAHVPLSIIVADIDRFKGINDKHGHQIGDVVLKAFGSILNTNLRRTDLVGRIGGEEFCIVLWNAPEKGGILVAESLRSHFEAADIVGLPAGVEVSASFGVVEVQENEDFATAFARADKSMYRAKQTGRNRVCSSAKPALKNARNPFRTAGYMAHAGADIKR